MKVILPMFLIGTGWLKGNLLSYIRSKWLWNILELPTIEEKICNVEALTSLVSLPCSLKTQKQKNQSFCFFKLKGSIL